jgi:hypothetical protein
VLTSPNLKTVEMALVNTLKIGAFIKYGVRLRDGKAEEHAAEGFGRVMKSPNRGKVHVQIFV